MRCAGICPGVVVFVRLERFVAPVRDVPALFVPVARVPDALLLVLRDFARPPLRPAALR